MIGYFEKIEKLAEENTDFRRVLYSGTKLQLVLMSLPPGGEIGGEIHSDTDQFFRIEAGKGRAVIDGVTHKLAPGDGIVVPAGAHHNVICTGHEPLSSIQFMALRTTKTGLFKRPRQTLTLRTKRSKGRLLKRTLTSFGLARDFENSAMR